MLNVLVMRADHEPSDADLLKGVFDGSRPAWDALIHKYRRRVLVALLADGHSLDEAGELAQEAWVRLWAAQQAGKLERLELPGLAVAQARFLAKDAWRRQKTRSSAAAALGTTAAVEVPSSEAQVSTRQQLLRVQAALETLPASQQRIFRLAQTEGLPHADIAAQVGLSLQRVRQIIWEVRTALRAAMEDV
jgi:RNA polymerase sigma-70 factor (ECF subfamily)